MLWYRHRFTQFTRKQSWIKCQLVTPVLLLYIFHNLQQFSNKRLKSWPNLLIMAGKLATMVGVHKIQSTMFNSSLSEYNFFVRINHGNELRVPFNMGSQWSVSRGIVRIKCSDELSVRWIKRSPLYHKGPGPRLSALPKVGKSYFIK